MMSDLQAMADRVEIEALCGEFTDSAMMGDYDRAASLFTPDGALRMPHASVELSGREAIRALGPRREAVVEYLVQNTHQGVIQLNGDTASGRAYMAELIRLRDGSSHLNYGIYHDRYQRTPHGWKFAERVYEIRYRDISPLRGSPPDASGEPAHPPAENKSSASEEDGDRWRQTGMRS
jgi:ketosteroid isomerase-like protein